MMCIKPLRILILIMLFILTAVLPVALVPVHTDASSIVDPPPVSVLHIHGLDDRSVLFSGGVGKGFDRSARPLVPDTIARWRMADRCEAPRKWVVDSVTTDSGRCAISPRPVAKRILELDDPSTALNATSALWTFFERVTAGRNAAVSPAK